LFCFFLGGVPMSFFAVGASAGSLDWVSLASWVVAAVVRVLM